MHHPRSLFTSINVCHPPSLHHLRHHPLHIQRRPQFPVCGLSFATFLRLNLRTTARRGGRVLVSISCAGAARRGAWAERSRREPGGVLGVAPHSLTAPSSYSRTSLLPRAQCSEFWRYIINTPRLSRLIFANLCQILFFKVFLLDGWARLTAEWYELNCARDLALRQLDMPLPWSFGSN